MRAEVRRALLSPSSPAPDEGSAASTLKRRSRSVNPAMLMRGRHSNGYHGYGTDPSTSLLVDALDLNLDAPGDGGGGEWFGEAATATTTGATRRRAETHDGAMLRGGRRAHADADDEGGGGGDTASASDEADDERRVEDQLRAEV